MNQASVCIVQRLIYMYLDILEIVVASIGEDEANGNPFSSFCSPILFLGNILKKEINKTLRNNFMNPMKQ